MSRSDAAAPGVPSRRVPTGVPGLDALLEGGLLSGSVHIVQGPPGGGKTICGNQICFAAASRGEGALYVTLLAESHARMLGHMRRMRFFDARVVNSKVRYLSAFKELESSGLPAVQRLLRREITGRVPAILVLDGLVSAEEAAPSAREYRKFIHELQTVASMSGCVVLLLSSTERERPFRAEQTMVDGVLELSDDPLHQRTVRSLEIRKMRGTNPVLGRHTVEIDDGGLTVYRRFEVDPLEADSTPPSLRDTRKLPFEVQHLDSMLHGGLQARSVTMLLGPSGCGKTILGLQFLMAGARHGETGVLFGFYERPEALRAKAARIGMDLEAAERAGLVTVHWQRPSEGAIDVLGARLFDVLQRTRAVRLFIDGMQELQGAIEQRKRVRHVMGALSDGLERRGVTTVYTAETPDLFGPRIESPVLGASAMTHNILLLRHVELNAHLHRLISILKIRDGSYDSAIREFRITDEGIDVADTFESADRILTGTAEVLPRSRRKPRGEGSGAVRITRAPRKP